MKMNIKRLRIISGIFAAAFLLLILMVKTIDVAAIGPEGTTIGLSRLNGAFQKAVGINVFWYVLTEILGIIALIFAGALAVGGLLQLIFRKSLRKVDQEILCVGGLYAVTLFFYAFFEKVIVNFRPVLMTGGDGPEASFPSSHTVLICIIFGSLLLILKKYVKDPRWVFRLRLAFSVILLITVIGRLLSGVHWLTDIVGGILLSASLLTAFSAVLYRIEQK